ncbi:ABC transporter substrate-binding protein [Kitasatospora sp. NPDC057223]|uniref:ABC transporter substrate-binding protein n=1 Tax=Kitasatospora sp. NPDC057223 TaxID=3346055 RepID=UPI003636E20F
MRTTRTTATVAAAATALLLSACGSGATPGQDTAAPREGGTLVFATGDDEPTCLDPQNRGNMAQALLGQQFLQSLFYQDEKGEIRPWLAASWEAAPDGLSWTVKLRTDVVFSDGTPLDAAAVKANIERVQDPATLSSTGRLALAKVASVQAPDTSTVVIKLSTPDSALLESLSQVWLPIESPAGFTRGLAGNCEQPIGTGPFQVQNWARQDAVTLVRNPHFNTPAPGAAHTGPARLDKIVWRFVPDSTTRFAALQSGQVHVIDTIAPQHAVAAKSDPALSVTIASRPGEPVELELNTRRAPFDDLKVRQAFFASADIKSALASVYIGTVSQATSLLSSATRHAVPATAQAYDPAKAAALLDEAGWSGRDTAGYRTKDGKRLTAVLPYSAFIPLEAAVYEQIQATALKSGFEVKLQPLETAAWWTVNNTWDYDAIPVYYTKNSADVLRITYHSAANADAKPGTYHANTVHLANPELDALLDQASQVSDDARRAELYKQAQQLITAGAYTLPVYEQQTRLGQRSNVHGLRLAPSLALPDLYDAWIS